jgi:ribosomal protein L19E
MCSMEIWKDIKGYEGLYQASNKGNIKSLIKRNGKEVILKQAKDNSGYNIVTLCKNKNKKTKTVHRLVALTFLENNKKQVNHKDGNKNNNHLENLELVSAKENINHAIKNGLLKHNTKQIAELKRKIVLQIDVNTNKIINKYISAHEAAKITGFNRGNISTCCRLNKIMYNYKWKYEI